MEFSLWRGVGIVGVERKLRRDIYPDDEYEQGNEERFEQVPVHRDGRLA
jgi:hypothetical protein